MGLMNEYIGRGLSANDLEDELLKLIAQYNKATKRYLMIYSSALSKPIPGTSLSMDDYYITADLLPVTNSVPLDVYIETPGGSGEAAEEMVKLFRSRFEVVNFIISGEAKSAGTLMALSGDTIGMTTTGSLGPVDAQVVIGRGQISAHDYMEWINDKQEEAQKTGMLSPFDATMIAQISPGELNGVNNALEFAHDLVVDWLPKYKFKNWSKTETKKTSVTVAMKELRAKEIAKALTDHSKWRSHGRSLKIADLESIGLKIDLIDGDKVAELVNKIQVVLRLLFSTTNTYKAFAVEGSKIFVTATVSSPAGAMDVNGQSTIPSDADNVQLELACPKCGKVHKIYAKLKKDKKIDDKLLASGFKKIPKDLKLNCDCGFEFDLSGVKNEIESQSGRKVVE